MARSESAAIRLANFFDCDAGSCPLISTPHIIITTFETELTEENVDAVAISYTWGEFNRTEQVLGHDLDGTIIKIMLGAEWNVAEVGQSLLSLTESRGGCWMDQLCIPSKESEIRKTLAKIPTIYKSLDVVVLLPGRPCKCLQAECQKMMGKIGESENEQAMFKAIDACAANALSCLNMISCCSWFDRVWTRQELLYSKTIRACWTGHDVTACVPVSLDSLQHVSSDVSTWGPDLAPIKADQVSSLNPYPRLVFENIGKKKYEELFPSQFGSVVQQMWQQQNFQPLLNAIPRFAGGVANSVLTWPAFQKPQYALARQKAEELNQKLGSIQQQWTGAAQYTAFCTLMAIQVNYLNAAGNAINEYIGRPYVENIIATPWVLNLFRFFAGVTLENKIRDNTNSDVAKELDAFAASLGRLRTSERSATQAYDFVNSVWIDCPGFHIAEKYRTMTVGALLYHALEQLRRNHSRTLLTAAPSSIFRHRAESGAIWNPSQYLGQTVVSKVSHVYRPLLSPFTLLPLNTEGHVPLQVFFAGAIPFSQCALDFRSDICLKPSAVVFDIMVDLMKHWAKDTLRRAQRVERTDEILAAREASGHGNRLYGQLALDLTKFYGAKIPATLWSGSTDSTPAPIEVRENFQARAGQLKDEGLRASDYRSRLISLALSTAVGSDPQDLTWKDHDGQVDHYSIIYELVVDVLGLDLKTCEAAGLRLITTPEIPALGLTRRKRADELTEQKKTIAATNKTVAMARQTDGTNANVFYEVEKCRDREYRAFGIWIPITLWPEQRIFATPTFEIRDKSRYDAVII